MVKAKTELCLNVKVIHVNHQLSKNASLWAASCKKAVQNIGFTYYEKTVNLNENTKQGQEAEARKHRYKAIESIATDTDIICTAHHLDDQIETFFIRILRGSGIKGLAAISAFRKHKHTWLARPLLSYTKDELKNYATKHGINYVEDESNKNNKFDRNYIRNEILPIIAKRFPSYQTTINRSINHIQKSSFWLNEIAKALFLEIKIKDDEIDLSTFYDFDENQKHAVIRYWLDVNKIQQVSEKKLKNLIGQMCQSASLSVNVNDACIKKYQHHCYLVTEFKDPDNTKRHLWDIKNTPIFRLEKYNIVINIKNLNNIINANDKVEIGFRKEADTVYIKGVGNQSLKKYFQKQSVPPWLRGRIPLLFINNKLVKVCL